jgi:putative DNA primase/helicase
MHDIRQIARILGGEVTGPCTANVPGPGHSPRDRSLSIKIAPAAPAGFVVYSHAGDDPIACRDYISSRLRLPNWNHGKRNQSPLVVSERAVADDKAPRTALAMKIWQESADPKDSIVARYLSEHRGLDLPLELASHTVRFHGGLFFERGKALPGMVSLFRIIETGAPCAIQRTFLDPRTASKVDRKNLGSVKGAAIMCDAPSAGSLTIGEGFETVLSARAAGFAPAWAVGSTGAIREFPVLADLAEITILEENDAASRRDVMHCADRYLATGRPVNILSSKIGSDINDGWRALK